MSRREGTDQAAPAFEGVAAELPVVDDERGMLRLLAFAVPEAAHLEVQFERRRRAEPDVLDNRGFTTRNPP